MLLGSYIMDSFNSDIRVIEMEFMFITTTALRGCGWHTGWLFMFTSECENYPNTPSNGINNHNTPNAHTFSPL